MRKGTFRHSALTFLALGAIAACGGSDSTAESPNPDEAGGNSSADGTTAQPASESGATTWVGNLDGAPTTVEIGVEPAGIPELEAAEAHRELVGAEPLKYVRVTIDNSGGADPVPSAYADINGGTGANPDLVLDFACAYVNSYWSVSPDATTEDAAAAFESRQTASDALDCMGNRSAEPGATAAYWLAVPAGHPEIESLSIRFNDFAPAG